MTARSRHLFPALTTLCLILTSPGCDSSSSDESSEPTAGSESAATGSNESATPSGGSEWAPGAGETQDEAVEVSADAFQGAGLLLPRPNQLLGWYYIDQPAYYTPDDLSNLINGGAASYIALGIEQTAYGVLQMLDPPDSIGRAVGLEIYIFRMSTGEAAQAKWDDDHQTGTCEQRDDLSAQHCLTSSSLDLRTGPYYVRFNLDAQDPSLIEPMVANARVVLENLSTGMRAGRPVVPDPPTQAVPAEGTGAAPQ